MRIRGSGGGLLVERSSGGGTPVRASGSGAVASAAGQWALWFRGGLVHWRRCEMLKESVPEAALLLPHVGRCLRCAGLGGSLNDIL